MERRSGPKSRTSIYLGVTQYRRTGRWEAHIWQPIVNLSRSSSRPGQQLHLGSFPTAEVAALAYDRAAIHFGIGAKEKRLNFRERDYSKDPFLMQNRHLHGLDFIMELRKIGRDGQNTNKSVKRNRRKPNCRRIASENIVSKPRDIPAGQDIPLHIKELEILAARRTKQNDSMYGHQAGSWTESLYGHQAGS